MQKNVIMLTSTEGKKILIGTRQIISIKETYVSERTPKGLHNSREIRSTEAMVTTNHVKETIADIYKLING
jgi:hypothetical protein